MSREQFHLDMAVESYRIADDLRDRGEDAWALVPLFYSAMHLIHARFDADGLPVEQRHPDHHTNRWDSDGGLEAWGTLDVVRDVYPSDVSQPYSKLFAASIGVRYGPSAPRGNFAEFWDFYEALRRQTA